MSMSLSRSGPCETIRARSSEIHRIISISFRGVDAENNIATQIRQNNAHSYEKYGNDGGGINATFNAARLRAAIIEFTP